MRTFTLSALAAIVLALSAGDARAQVRFLDKVDVERFNRRIQGRVVDYTNNEGVDRRVFSRALGRPRDVYVYLPPGYDPARFAYPLVVYLHMAFVDEHTFVGSNRLVELDRLIARGEFPPTVVVSPDGTISGENRTDSPHSLFVNGCRGAFQDYLVDDVIPFVNGRYSVRPEREARALLGVSAGGFGAMNLALKRRDLFASVATVAAPLNLRYETDRHRGYFGNFDPASYQPTSEYDPGKVVGKFYLGFSKTRAGKYLDPVFGCEPDPAAAVARENPADLLASTGLRPGELNIFVNYPGRDSFNFDAQAESFAWLAASRGVCVTTERVPLAAHTLPYFVHNHLPAFRWLACHLLPPAPIPPAPR